jgi:hypothetical protein
MEYSVLSFEKMNERKLLHYIYKKNEVSSKRKKNKFSYKKMIWEERSKHIKEKRWDSGWKYILITRIKQKGRVTK